MALYLKENIAHGTLLGIWKKEEALDQLEDVYLLNVIEEKEFEKIANESRKKEWLSTRILLTELLERRITISHNKNKKPFLKKHDSNITISHSRNFVAIILSTDYIPGIDIEQVSSRVEKVKHKFLNNNELSWCKSHSQLTACWSAKEAVFKIFEKDLDFHDMEIAEFDLNSNQGKFKASVIKPDKEADYIINYRIVENNILTYTLSKSAIN